VTSAKKKKKSHIPICHRHGKLFEKPMTVSDDESFVTMSDKLVLYRILRVDTIIIKCSSDAIVLCYVGVKSPPSYHVLISQNSSLAVGIDRASFELGIG